MHTLGCKARLETKMEHQTFPFTFSKRSISAPRLIYLLTIHLGACLAFFPEFFSATAVMAAIMMHFLSGCLGISIGLHRILSHKSIETSKALERLFVLFAIFEVHKPITWVARHRFHHKFAGTPLDPHNASEGFFWSHMGWLLPEEPDGFQVTRFAADIASDPFYRFLERYGFFVFLASLAALSALGGLPFLIWAGFVRLVIVGHSVWAINSFCHLCQRFGYRNYPTADGYNLRLLSYFTYGEGLHNNHHGSQRNPNFAVRPNEMDLGWLVLRSLIALRLAKRAAI
jgi:stearoyl-CoA desaturase (delta-9 desaturase)